MCCPTAALRCAQRRKVLTLLGIAAVVFACTCGGHAAAQTTILMGISPYGDAKVIVSNHNPLAVYLDKRGHQTTLLTAADTTVFYNRARADAYDLVFASGHIAASLVKEKLYRPLIRFDIGTRPTVYVLQDSPLRTLQDLRGRVLALPNQIDYTSLAMDAEFEANGMDMVKDLRPVYAKNHFNAALLLFARRVDAVVTLPQTMAQLQPGQTSALRILTEFGTPFPIYYLGAAHLGSDLLTELQGHLLAFHEDLQERQAPEAYWFNDVNAVNVREAIPSTPALEAFQHRLPALPPLNQ